MNNNETIKHPAWKHALEQMRQRGLAYGVAYSSQELADWMRCDPQSHQFIFGMLEIKHRIEIDDGYYMASRESGKSWKIVEAESHEDVAGTFDGKVRRYALRSVNIRNATLMNPAAQLSDSCRSEMQRNLEHAATRLALISRRNPPVKAITA